MGTYVMVEVELSIDARTKVAVALMQESAEGLRLLIKRKNTKGLLAFVNRAKRDFELLNRVIEYYGGELVKL